MFIYLLIIFLKIYFCSAFLFSSIHLKSNIISGKTVNITWENREYIKLNISLNIELKIISLNEKNEHKIRAISLDEKREPFITINELIPGGTYEIQFKIQQSLNNSSNNFYNYSNYSNNQYKNTSDINFNININDNNKILLYEFCNFTTKPNTPGRFIVWFRNETTLLVLWQPPYPAGIFDRYKVSIHPSDAFHSELYVEKESDPPGPAQAEFYGLIPGRAYTITVQTLSKSQLSKPTIAQYRTVPLPPSNITVDLDNLDTTSFTINWQRPKSYTEFDRYQALLTLRSTAPQNVDKDAPRVVKFSENLEPGKTYEIVIKTVSGNVGSWPVLKNITTKPLPVLNLYSFLTIKNEIELKWVPSNDSVQDSFIVKYHELEAFNSDGTVQVVKDTKVLLQNLLDGRNYSISVYAVSNKIKSSESITFQATRPASPVIEVLESVTERSLNVSWKSDVTSRQDKYYITWLRLDTKLIENTYKDQNWILLKDLYPGATYRINVSALSYGLKSEPHSYIQTLYPKPPEFLQIVKASNSTVILTWLIPKQSLIDNYIVRFRSISSFLWQEVGITNITSFEIKDLVAGEKYIFKVNTISNKIESPDAKEIEQTMYPNTIESVHHIIGSHNITFKLAVPLGRIDYYIIVYNPTADKNQDNSKQILSTNRTHFGDIIVAVIEGLKPGEIYSFRFYAVSHNLRSEEISLKARTKPIINSVINIVTYEQETKTLGIKFTPTPRRSSTFDRYRFQLTSDLSIPAQEKLYNDTNGLVLFDNLISGRLYNLSIWTVSNGIYSNPIIRETRLYPDPVRNLAAKKITDSEIILVWDQPYGDKDGYEITYLDQQTPYKLIRNFTFLETISYKNLRPHQNYSFEVLTISGYDTSTLLRSSPISQTFTTLESIPGKVALFHPIDVTPNSIKFEWHLPASEQNGIITGFEIKYFIKNNYFNYTNIASFNANANQGTIFHLQSGVRYVFNIQAHTKIGPGSSAQYEQDMPIWPPPTPTLSSIPIELTRTTQTIKIRFKKNFFSNAHGTIIHYSVIVIEDQPINYFNNIDDVDLPSWFDVQSKSIWPPYQTSDFFNPFENSRVFDFVIGADTNCEKMIYQQNYLNKNRNIFTLENTNLNEKKYCNGPLKSGTGYKIKIRAFTAPQKFTDTSFSNLMITEQDNRTLFITLVFLFFLLISSIVSLIVYQKRKLSSFFSFSSGKNGFGFKNVTTNNFSSLSFANNINIPNSLLTNSLMKKDLFETSSYANLTEFDLINSKKIKLINFSERFKLLSADSDFRFSEEFELLRHVGKESLCTAADLPVNRPKNRFTNILPYDHSRVKLQSTDDEEGSDYINANYIAGSNGPREYIVTQGPLHGTKDDFWRMCWEQNCKAIVMLTRCIEKGREKCDHYWPFNTQPVYYGDIQVTLLNESQYQNWTISEFKLSRYDLHRTVKHFHFTTWPDFGVPEPPHILVRFVKTFRERISIDHNKPIIVHCSAGVGRSGTFIAIDNVLQEIDEKDYINIFGLVYEMRKERVWMVQNEQQYICIHQCLLYILENNKQDLVIESPMPEMHENQGFEDDEGIAESGI